MTTHHGLTGAYLLLVGYAAGAWGMDYAIVIAVAGVFLLGEVSVHLD